MKKFVVGLGAAAAMLAAPALVQSASAETNVNIRVGTPAYKARAQGVVVTSGSHCRTVTKKVVRAGKTVITKKRVCS